jgi:[protein-PII] uridylyltransferase
MQAAKITTLGERVEDVFHIVDAQGHPLGDNEQSQALSEHIQRELDEHIQELTA